MVAQRYLGDLELPDEDVCAGIVKMCSVVHTPVQEQGDVMMAELRRTYACRSLLDLIGCISPSWAGNKVMCRQSRTR